MKNRTKRCQLEQFRLEELEPRITPDAYSAGPYGINALALGLTGQGVHIGMTEIGRPGKPGFDNPQNSHPDVKPAEVFHQDRPAKPNDNVWEEGAHGTAVAGIMIADGAAANKGIAPGAILHASADKGATDDTPGESLLAMQKIARGGSTPTSDDTVAINLSWGKQAESGRAN